MNKLSHSFGIYGFHFLNVTAVFSGSLIAKESPVDVQKNLYSPYVQQIYPTNVYWGDTHLHTSLSFDAISIGGNRKLGPDEAYRFASGHEVTTHKGMKVTLRRPLDFLVAADHGMNLGLLSDLDVANPMLLKTNKGRKLFEQLQVARAGSDDKKPFPESMFNRLFASIDFKNVSYQQSVWDRVIKNAERYNDPGRFTTFIGYEWTASYENRVGAHLHRVVIFRDGAQKTEQVLPFTKFDSQKPEDLWSYMEAYQAKTGGDVLAIPHNGNLSNGQLFALKDSSNNPLSVTYAKQRSRWEPLFEVTQVKGDSETHPLLSPTDEFADYETWSGAKYSEYYGEAGGSMRPYEYARSALKLGLQKKAELGVNPFKFGMIGSTDSHTSLATADNDNFWGKNVVNGPEYPRRMLDPRYPVSLGLKDIEPGWRLNAAGYAAVWATENTREALFAAMKRKEVYATTGPRMTVRFFGGWEYDKNDALKPDLARIGYSKGVPMGGDLTHALQGKTPQFLIRATKDPDGANLDRVQIIKGWHDKQGELHEKIYNVALSDGRKKNWRGKVKPVGTTVDIEDASYTNSIGDPELAVVWTDPDFDKDELAFYYVRVLEIPTPRWTAYDAKYFAIKDIPDEVPMVTQERAYTSPIWYTP